MFLDNLNFSQNEILLILRELNFSSKVGIEREGLRIKNGKLSTESHPKSLGSALTNKYITTDFSEAQLELVTPPFNDKNDTIQFLDDIHHFTSQKIDDEIIWPFSMPLALDSDEEIVIASYGKSNLAKFKEIYRNGLSKRYGKMMQIISGVHYNFSLSDMVWNSIASKNPEIDSKNIRSAGYFNLLRNIYKINWLVIYLSGASPVLANNFLTKDSRQFNKLSKQTSYMPYSTSLRMSEYGYQNENRKKLEISINSIEQYISDLQKATKTKHDEFIKIKAISPNQHAQINENILQIDDEYYAIARVKSKCTSDRPTTFKLKKTGVDFIELRSLDSNPFSRIGINEETIFFLEVLLTYCFMKESMPLTSEEIKNNKYNESLVAKEGRKPKIKLNKDGKSIELHEWGNQIIDDLYPVADALDGQKKKYSSAVDNAKEKINDPSLTLSAQILDLLNSKNISFLELGMNIGKANKGFYLKNKKTENLSWSLLSKEAKESVIKQEMLEKSDKSSFKDYLERYFDT